MHKLEEEKYAEIFTKGVQSALENKVKEIGNQMLEDFKKKIEAEIETLALECGQSVCGRVVDRINAMDPRNYLNFIVSIADKK